MNTYYSTSGLVSVLKPHSTLGGVLFSCYNQIPKVLWGKKNSCYAKRRKRKTQQFHNIQLLPKEANMEEMTQSCLLLCSGNKFQYLEYVLINILGWAMEITCFYLRNQWGVIFILSSCRSWLNGTIKILKNKTNITHRNSCSFSFVDLKMNHVIKLWSFLMLIFTVLSISFLCLVIKIPLILGEEICIQIGLYSD